MGGGPARGPLQGRAWPRGALHRVTPSQPAAARGAGRPARARRPRHHRPGLRRRQARGSAARPAARAAGAAADAARDPAAVPAARRGPANARTGPGASARAAGRVAARRPGRARQRGARQPRPDARRGAQGPVRARHSRRRTGTRSRLVRAHAGGARSGRGEEPLGGRPEDPANRRGLVPLHPRGDGADHHGIVLLPLRRHRLLVHGRDHVCTAPGRRSCRCRCSAAAA